MPFFSFLFVFLFQNTNKNKKKGESISFPDFNILQIQVVL